MSVLSKCEPKEVFRFFEEISSIPRESFHMQEISNYMKEFATERGLSCEVDKAYNVVMKKPGTKGMEKLTPVILQGHMDMVCEKTIDSSHDFQKDGIQLVVKDGFVKAKDTSLGADDGVAVAFALALLDSTTIPHPPLEVILTTEEEVGMDGAKALDISGLEGRHLINIDSDEEGVFLCGSAGGVIQTVSLPIERIQKSGKVLHLAISGLKGGHSGIEIGNHRRNANKLLAEALYHLLMHLPIYIVDFKGGSKENVIPPDATASIIVNDLKKAKAVLQEIFEELKETFKKDEPGMRCTIRNGGKEAFSLTNESTRQVLYLLNVTPNGVQEYSSSIQGLPETSLNLGVVQTLEEELKASFSLRSSVAQRGRVYEERIKMIAEKLEGTCALSNRYPGWEYKENSPLRDLFVSSYKEVMGKEPSVTAVHAGLECGLFIEKCPDLDVISFGANVYDIHSVQERMEIQSVERNWKLLLHVLASWAEIGGR